MSWLDTARTFEVPSMTGRSVRQCASDEEVARLTANHLETTAEVIGNLLTDGDGPWWDALWEAVEDYLAYRHVC